MPGKNDEIAFEGCEPSTLFREFAAECMELAQTGSSPEKQALYMKMASVWFQMAVRWEKKSNDGFGLNKRSQRKISKIKLGHPGDGRH